MIEKSISYCSPEKRKFFLIATAFATAMVFLGSSAVAIAIPQIRVSLGVDFINSLWIFNAYLLFVSALMLFGHALGERFGARKILSYGVWIFIFASLACALATTGTMLIGFRALQGVGAAIIMPCSLSVITTSYTPKEKGGVMAIWFSASVLIMVFGVLTVGLLMSYGGAAAWRWIFALNVPIGLLVIWILWGPIPEGTSAQLKERGLTDLLGVRQTGQEPMIDLALLRSRLISRGSLIIFLIGLGLGSLIVFLPMLIIVAWKLPPSFAGGLFAPFSISLVLTVCVIRRMAGAGLGAGGARALTLGLIIMTAAYLALAWGVVQQSYWLGLLPALALLGFGLGLGLGRGFITLSAGAGMNTLVISVAGVVSIAGFGAFVSYIYGMIIGAGKLHPELAGLLIEANFGARLTGALYQVSTIELQLVAMNHTMIALFLVLAGLTLIAIPICWVRQESKSDR
ncbi:MAG: MFS transporter [Rhizobiaceae bacterium]